MQYHEEIDKLKKELSILQEKNKILQESENVLKDIATSFTAITAEDFFKQVTSYISTTVDVEYAFVGEIIPKSHKINILAGQAAGEPMPIFDYDYSNTPCEKVISQHICSYPSGVTTIFPNDSLLTRMNIEGYIGAPLFDTNGKPIGIFVLFSTKPIKNIELSKMLLNIFSGRCGVEIERMRFERQYQESDIKYRTLVEHVKDGIFIIENSRLNYLNPAFINMLQYDDDVLYNNNFTEFIAPDDRNRVLDYHQRRINGDITAPTTYSVNLIKNDGSIFPVIIQASIVDILGSKLVIGTVTDITEQFKLQKDKFDIERQLMQTQKLESLGILTGGIAHNFNNLLMAIIGNLDLAMLRMSDLNADISLLSNAMEGAKRAADLTNKMLTYSGKGTLSIEKVNLNSRLMNNYNLLKSSINSTIQMKIECGDNIPDIKADPDQIDQVAMNLVINSAEAIGMEKGEIIIKTGFLYCDNNYLSNSRLEYIPDAGNYVYLEVSDDGCGMDHEIIHHLFDPFYSTKFLGRGLGMPAVMGIVKSHKGAIILNSVVGEGTEIRVLFPAIQNSIIDLPALINEDPDSLLSKKIKKTILIADDDLNVRIISKEIIESFGYNTLLAKNGQDAIELFKNHREIICCVLLDLTMPILDGVESLRAIRAMDANALVILSSGYNESEAIRRFSADMPSGFIQKPYTVRLLQSVINRIIGVSVN